MIGRFASDHTTRRRWPARRKAVLLLAAIVLVGVLAAASTFSIGPRETGFVLSFGRTVRGPLGEPGLLAKWPWQRVRIYDERVRLLSCEPATNLTADHEALVVQPAAFWRVPPSGAGVLMRKGLSDDELERLLGEVVWRHVDEQIAKRPLTSWLGEQGATGATSGGWAEVLEEITRMCRQEAGERFAVEVIEVRLIQLSRPASLHVPIFRQMIADREREADAIRQDAARRSAELAAAARRRGNLFVAAAAQRAGRILHEARMEASRLDRENEGPLSPATHPATTTPATATAAP